uniref:Uncharacterized protein n=1 Tax=Oryza rufipogon TaxID=4529 RepID=A0A0E0NN77_ORYRU
MSLCIIDFCCLQEVAPCVLWLDKSSCKFAGDGVLQFQTKQCRCDQKKTWEGRSGCLRLDYEFLRLRGAASRTWIIFMATHEHYS